MNRGLMLGAVTVMAVSLVAGCKSAPKVQSDKDLFGMMQEKANQITAAGGLAAVGLGESKSIALAIDKAKTRGRTEMAHIIETKIDSLKKDFQEEVGQGKGAEFNELFSSASKHVAHQILSGTVPKDIKYESKEGITRAVALMVQDPKVVADAFAAQQQTQQAVYTRFRASQAFKELDEEVKKFEDFKKKDSGVAP
jgi:hypothetical protein